jgi:hypothetical protein
MAIFLYVQQARPVSAWDAITKPKSEMEIGSSGTDEDG